MKYILVCIIALVCLNVSSAQSYEAVKDRTGQQLLKGFITDSLLRADTTQFKWFADNERLYEPAGSVVNSFANKKDSLAFMVFLGTWCMDSHYVVPRFYKILKLAGINSDKVSLFALDRTKKDAAHFATTFNIQHVPTIIILKEGREIGRVVEYGVTGKFDEELAKILDAK